MLIGSHPRMENGVCDKLFGDGGMLTSRLRRIGFLGRFHVCCGLGLGLVAAVVWSWRMVSMNDSFVGGGGGGGTCCLGSCLGLFA